MSKARVSFSDLFPSPFFVIALSWICLLTMLQACGRSNDPDELVMMLEKRISTLDPRRSSDSADERMRQLIFNGLTRKNEKFDPIPDLAERFESSPDYKTFTFYLRPGVKFHNNRPLSALDVKYTFETMLAKGFPSQKKAEFVNALAAVEVKDERTIIFRCNDPFPGFPNAIIPIGIIPTETTELQDKKPIGTGPFKFESYTEDQEVRLSANQEYFDGAPTIKGLRVKIIPDNSTRESELRKGSVDLAINADFDPITVEGLRTADGLKVEMIDGTNVTHLGVNLLDPILKDQRVRQALAFAIDREAIIRGVLRGQARPAYSVLPTSQWAYEPEVEKYPYNPERAKQLLDEAGRREKDGKPRMNLSLKTSTISASRKIGEAMQEQLRRIGVALNLQPLERQKLTQDMVEGNFQLYLNTSVGGNQSTDFFKFAYSTQSIPPNGQNRSRYSNAIVDRLLVESQTATKDRQKQIFSQVQKTLAIELPQIYLWYPATIVVYRNTIANLKLEPSGDWQVVRNVKIVGQ
ncbi:MAG: ABC transporter substrate-binding protein [Acidobacteria bacterium]|nr:ABC transporter substrate-binding protein [Acidobacteriota bacterium]